MNENAVAWTGALASVLIVSLLSLVGALTFVLRRETLARVLPTLVSLAVGALLGNVFFHLLPELGHDGFSAETGALVFLGMLMFFGLERYLGGHEHGHVGHATHIAPYAWLNLIGDALHNFADGLLIAAAWMQSTALGLATTVAVALHEIPQELGDVGILMHARLTRKQALLLNLGTGLVAMLGAFVGLALGGRIEGFHGVVLALTAGGFLYIAAADLMPELHRERRTGAAVLQMVALIAGATLTFLVREPGH